MKYNRFILPSLIFTVLCLSACETQKKPLEAPTFVEIGIKSRGSSQNNLQNVLRADTNAKDIEEIVSIETDDPQTGVYYFNPNESYNIEIKLHNPDKQDINSITIGDKTYSPDSFQIDSNKENILISEVCSSNSGYYSFTLDSIKYSNDKNIDLANANTSYTIGVSYSEEPFAILNERDVGYNDVTFNISVYDVQRTIKQNTLKAYICDGEAIVDECELSVGSNNLKFSDLFVSSYYQVGIACVFDMINGDGQQVKWLFKNSFDTQSIYSISNVVAGKDNITFDVNSLDDTCPITSIEVFDSESEQLVRTIETNERVVPELLSSHSYDLVLSYSYEIKGQSYSSSIAEKNIKTIAKVSPTLSFFSTSSDKVSITYSVNVSDVDNILNIDSVELLKGDNVVKTNGKLLSGTFDELLSNNEYKIRVNYNYDLNDGNGSISDSITEIVSTAAKIVPTISISSISADKTSISYSVDLTDIDSITTVDSVNLVKGGSIVKTNGSSLTGTFDNLLSNNDYEVMVSYSYDLNDGDGIHNETTSKGIKTQAKIKPTFSIEEPAVTESTIVSQITITDPDSIGYINEVSLSKGDEVIINSDKEVNFTGLEQYTDYKLTVQMAYDLNDGDGIQYESKELSIRTLPHLSTTLFKVLNSSVISEGETIYIQANLDNPSGVTPTSAVINGQTYNCSSTTTTSKLYLDVPNEGQFAGGIVSLTLEKITGVLNEEEFEFDITENNSQDISIRGHFEVLKVSIVDENFKEIKWAYKNQKAYVLLTLDNETGYEITAINGSVPSSLTKLGNNYYFDATKNDGFNTQMLNSITYGDSTFSKTINLELKAAFYRTKSDSDVTISTISDLQNTSNGYCYVLNNDLDLSGSEWNPTTFNGVLLGNGHVIRNMSKVGTYTLSEYEQGYYGLFTTANGVICETGIEAASLIMTINTGNTSTKDIYIGLFCAFAGQKLDLINCYASDSIISISNQNTYGCCRIGGLVGYHMGDLINCYADVTISAATNYTTELGGLVSCAGNGDFGSYLYNSISFGNCSKIASWKTFKDSINNCYSTSSNDTDPSSLYGAKITGEQANSKAFYTETLGWSEDVWDFTNLNISSNHYPRLKNN